VVRQVERHVVMTCDETIRELQHPAHATEAPKMRLDESDPEAASGAWHGL